jgi:hypothetical protein
MRAAVALAVALVLSPGPLLAQGAATTPQPALTPDQIETFLLTAKIIRTREAGKGVTNSRVATLSDGKLTHDAHVQDVSVELPLFQSRTRTEVNFKDQFRYNIAAYRISRLLGLTNVPVSVQRRVGRSQAAVTWWIDDVLMDELERLKREKAKTIPAGWQPSRTAGYIYIMRVFDELIANTDRNVGNQIWTSDGKLWLIDHTRAFRLQLKLAKPQILVRCDRQLLKGLRSLTVASVTTAVDESLTKDEISALIARRDLIVKHFEDRIKAVNEPAILYTLMP